MLRLPPALVRAKKDTQAATRTPFAFAAVALLLLSMMTHLRMYRSFRGRRGRGGGRCRIGMK